MNVLSCVYNELEYLYRLFKWVMMHETFVLSKYANSVSHFFLYWMRIICCIYKDFVRQLKTFLTSYRHLFACEMSLGWGHLITWMDPSVGHLNGVLARVGGNLNNNFQNSQMPGGDVEASIWPIHYFCPVWTGDQWQKKVSWMLEPAQGSK